MQQVILPSHKVQISFTSIWHKIIKLYFLSSVTNIQHLVINHHHNLICPFLCTCLITGFVLTGQIPEVPKLGLQMQLYTAELLHLPSLLCHHSSFLGFGSCTARCGLGAYLPKSPTLSALNLFLFRTSVLSISERFWKCFPNFSNRPLPCYWTCLRTWF